MLLSFVLADYMLLVLEKSKWESIIYAEVHIYCYFNNNQKRLLVFRTITYGELLGKRSDSEARIPAEVIMQALKLLCSFLLPCFCHCWLLILSTPIFSSVGVSPDLFVL